MESSILYIFITCQTKYEITFPKITNMMKNLNNQNFIIIVGGSLDTFYDENNKTLNIQCNDFYEGLPEKMIKTYKFIYENDIFKKYKYICKLDDDVEIKEFPEENILSEYCGKIGNVDYGDRNWHIGKCSKDNKFNNKEYQGIYVPWCMGGYGYIISREILKYIKDETGYDDEIYEDLYIAKILNKNNIFPKELKTELYFTTQYI